MAAAPSQEKRIRIVVDTAALASSAGQANSIIAQIGSGNTSISGLTAGLNQAAGAATNAGHAASAANDNFTSMGAAAGHASGGLIEMVKHLGTMTLALAGLGFLTAGVHELAEGFIEAMDSATEVAGRLALVTSNTQEFVAAQAAVASIANQTRASLTDVGELYQKIGIQAQHLGASQAQVSTMTKTFAETLKVSASTTQQSQAAMRQLGEAFDMNSLQGRHFMAMQTDNIAFMKLLAASMCVTQGKLKELATDGKVTGEELKKALTDPTLTAGLQKQFDKMPVSFADVRTSIKNTLVQLAGDFLEGSGLNNSLRALYDKIADFGTSAGPAFQKIGAAARAAFEAFAPMAGAALASIRPVFSFVIDNGPQLIQLLKVGVEVWLAYTAAQKAALAVNLAGKFLTEMNMLGSFLSVARGGAADVGLLKSAFLIAADGVETFTASLLANPFTALAVAATAIIALLYEFRDSISVSSDGVTSFGDLMRATWQAIGPLASSAWDAIKSGATSAWDTIKGVFSGVGDFLYSIFQTPINAIVSLWNSAFGDLPGGFEGVAYGVARIMDAMVGSIRGDLAVLKVLWNELPETIFNALPGPLQSALTIAKEVFVGIGSGIVTVFNGIVSVGSAIGGAISGVFNSVGSFIETWVNKSIDVLNLLIGAADKAGASISTIGHVAIGKIQAPAGAATGFTKLGEDAAAAFKGAFGHGVENTVRGIWANAHAIGAARQAAGKGATTGGGMKPAGEAEGGDKDADKDAAKKAKEIADYWATLKESLATAKLFGIELARQTEEYKLQKILKRDLTTDEKSSVDSLVDQIAAAKSLTEVNKAAFELRNKDSLLQARQVGLTDDQGKIEDVLDAQRLSALNAGVNINSADYKTALDKLRTELQINQALEKQVEARKKALDFAKQYSPAFAVAGDLKTYNDGLKNFDQQWTAGDLPNVTSSMHDAIMAGADRARADIANKPFSVALDYTRKAVEANGTVADKQKYLTGDYSDLMKNLTDAHDAGRMSDTAFKTAVDKAGEDFKSAMAEAADTLSAKFTTIGNLFSQLGSLLGGKAGEVANGIGGVAKSIGSFTTTQDDVAKQITSVFGSNSQNSDFVKGLSQGVGKAFAGLQIGDEIAGLGKSLGLKGGETGSKIGGAIGGIVGGPVGSIIGAIGGGLISSLFYKAPKGTATVTGVNSGDVSLSGNSAQLKQTASGMAGEVQSGLANAAAQLGATIGAFNVEIGMYKDSYRVNTDGKALGGVTGSGAQAFTSEADAVAAAIKIAVKQGALQGLSDIAQKAINTLDIDSAITFVQDFNKTMSDYQSIIDPVGAAVQGVLQPLATLTQSMQKVGASTADLTKLQDYQTLSLKKALDSQLSTLTDLQKTLNGDGSGRTALDRLTDDLSQFATFKSQIDGGSTSVDQQAFSSLASEIQGLVGSVYGTSTSQGQDILSQLSSENNTLMANITAQFNKDAGTTDVSADANSITNALSSQTSQIVAAQTTTNALLQQLIDQSKANGEAASSGDGGGTTVSANATSAAISSGIGYNGQYVGQMF